jgi:hypothetical protein
MIATRTTYLRQDIDLRRNNADEATVFIATAKGRAQVKEGQQGYGPLFRGGLHPIAYFKNRDEHSLPPIIMHRPRTKSSVFLFRIAAILLFANWLLAPAAVGLLGKSLLTYNHPMTVAGSGLGVFCMLLVVTQWIAGSAATCPLCRTAVLAPKDCSKHRRAKTLLGSHRLRVALEILFRNRFRCPYCNESTTMELRETIQRPQGHRSQLD